MTNLNNDFMESYKHLDKICKEIFNSEKGVTTYIDTMKDVNEDVYKRKHTFICGSLKNARKK